MKFTINAIYNYHDFISLLHYIYQIVGFITYDSGKVCELTDNMFFLIVINDSRI